LLWQSSLREEVKGFVGGLGSNKKKPHLEGVGGKIHRGEEYGGYVGEWGMGTNETTLSEKVGGVQGFAVCTSE